LAGILVFRLDLEAWGQYYKFVNIFLKVAILQFGLEKIAIHAHKNNENITALPIFVAECAKNNKQHKIDHVVTVVFQSTRSS
jgi:hypothetical protein